MATGRSDGLNQDYSRGFHLWLASRLDARHTVRRWFGEQRVNMNTPTTPKGLPPLLDDLAKWEDQVRRYDALGACNPLANTLQQAREALAAQEATLESIHKIIECAGPEAADEIADLLGYPSVEWPSDQAASVEPVGKIINSGGNTGSLPEHPLLVWLGGVPPVGTELYASAPPSPANVPGAVEPLTKDDIDKLAEVLEVTSLDEVEPETVYAFTRAIEARFAPQPQAVVASSPAQAVDAVGESCAIFDSRGYYDWYDTEAQAKAWCDRYNARNVDDPLRPYTYVRLDALRAALQASSQPQAQQGAAGPLKLNVCHSQNASQTPQADLSLTAAPQEWSPAYTRGPARQSAPVAAVPAMVPLTEEQMVSAVRPLCNTDQVAERLVAVSIDEYRAIEAASARLNDLAVGDGAQPIKDTP